MHVFLGLMAQFSASLYEGKDMKANICNPKHIKTEE
jgi:hypothetical protein